MSGDVQPRKRKDKKKKKDDLSVEEPRGTAAAFGEGDVFMHSQSEHGTGGHWCAKVIFFSLLAVLITLIGLIILENRGLTELEANSVETKYSGVLEGWIEDAPDDDHHDEHTLELKHHDEDDHDSGIEHDDDDEDDGHDDDDGDDDHENNDEDEEDDDDTEETDQNVDDSEEADNADDDDDSEEVDNADDDDDNEKADQNVDNSEEADDGDDDDNDDEDNYEREGQNINTAEDEDDIEEPSYRKFYESNDAANKDDDPDLQKEESDEQTENDQDEFDYNKDEQKGESDEQSELDQKADDDDVDNDENHDDSVEENDDVEDKNDDDSNEFEDYLQNNAAQEDEEEHEEEEEEPANIEIETIEKEVSDNDAVSAEEPANEEEEDDSREVSEELSPNEDDSAEDDDVEFLEPDELDELPIVEPITAPKGKPLAEVGESPSTEKPQDTLADEEVYEKQQEELRKEREQASQGMWLKLTVGGALLVATHAVLRRATASRESDTEEDEQDFREETPLSDRRMTLISEPVPPPTVTPTLPEVYRPIEREVIRESTVNVQSSSPEKEEIEDDEEEEIIITKPAETPKDTIDKELYSDEEDIEEEEEEEIVEPIKATPQQAVPQAPQTIPDVTKEVTPEPDEDDDVEIIDEEQLEEELEEEEISDVDDAELLSRLEEKYGRLPEPDRRTNKDGGNSIEDEWPNEPADVFWSDQLDQAQRDLREGDWSAAVEKASAPSLRSSGRARYIAAQALDAAAEANKDNQLLNKAIAAYLELLKMNDRLSDKKLLEVASRTLDRIKFRGTYLSAEPVYKLLIRRFPDDPAYRNNLTISLLMANRVDLAENVLKETLERWPNDRIALAHHGFILKTLHNRFEEAVEAFTKALEGDTGAANEARFYYHLGDALLLLGRFEEAHEVHKRGTALGHFLSPSQRSLYNVDRLKSKPWWNIDQTPYSRIARALEKSWKEILKEGEAATALYEKEKEGLKERGEWSQLDLFVRGREVPNRCSRAPVTCGIVKSEAAASGCRRGQIKFSMMEAGTHVRPHVGPTNCRLRMHLGLSNTKDTFIRVDREIRQWQTGKVLMFDDSFEHEVWHNGTGSRLVLIVDVWHPDLTPAERRQLPAI